ncbi:uncharacterized protein MONBRDRAFT_37787 [Monosiga brevicollis MX1]|uniref:Uncharacterized protein n=1 Tax=Monosiga brevicollis TaxID=81824 RepID=A9V406_MONBE|nr:uncharacterized protein MONBRDRAFT_37787 [Monosiga brevicollis MX1]EDQ87801.1 predicted protein [Monosiga brevicollis MX1]|eukprot:XP_001747334.1 hypothetical protein [Monosiga brevicollis MX1]
MSRLSFFGAAVNRLLRAVADSGRESGVSISAVIGAVTVEGVAKDIDLADQNAKPTPFTDAGADRRPKHAAYRGTALASEVPEACQIEIQMMLASKGDVDGSHLHQSLPWDAILKGPLMHSAEYRDAIMRMYAQTKALAKQGSMVPASLCAAICTKVTAWMASHSMRLLLDQVPAEAYGDDVDRAMVSFQDTLTQFAEREKQTNWLIKCARFDDALAMAKRSMQDCANLYEDLALLRKRLLRAQYKANSDLVHQLQWTGGLVLVALGCDYIGVVPSVPTIGSAAAEAVKKLALAGIVLAVPQAVAHWILSEEARVHLQQLEEAFEERDTWHRRLQRLNNQVLDMCPAMTDADLFQPLNQEDGLESGWERVDMSGFTSGLSSRSSELVEPGHL